MSSRWPLVIFWMFSLGSAVRGAEADLARYAAVDAAPVTTSIHLGTVSLTSSRFVRRGGLYTAAYVAKVFPFFFYNEKGELRIEVSDDALRRFARGSPIEFTGRAVRSDGRERAVSGRAIPLQAASGTLKVRIIVNRYFVLVFDTTYRLAAAGGQSQ